jgi:hypothetical protein
VNALRNRLLILLASAIPVCALAAGTPDHISRADLMSASPEVMSGPNMTIPLTSWPVDTKSFIEQHAAVTKGGSTLKAATDRATVYRPVKVCRLIDTRGNPAFITLPGPLTPGVYPISSSGVCGIPAGTPVAGISISFHVFNTTPNNGGTIAFLQQGAALTGVNAVFNPGAEWTAATANISLPDDSGNFEISITQSTVQVIVDVNGYYQDLDFVDTGTQELNIDGAVPAGGTVFEITNTDKGIALSGANLGGGPAINITGGPFNVAGGGIGSATTAFILEAGTAGGTICSGSSAIVVINNPLLDGNEDAIVLVTPRENATTSLGSGNHGPLLTHGPYNAFFIQTSGACGAGAVSHWAVRDASGTALPSHAQFSVFFMTTQ